MHQLGRYQDQDLVLLALVFRGRGEPVDDRDVPEERIAARTAVRERHFLLTCYDGGLSERTDQGCFRLALALDIVIVVPDRRQAPFQFEVQLDRVVLLEKRLSLVLQAEFDFLQVG